jgi:hypothetical protein
MPPMSAPPFPDLNLLATLLGGLAEAEYKVISENGKWA